MGSISLLSKTNTYTNGNPNTAIEVEQDFNNAYANFSTIQTDYNQLVTGTYTLTGVKTFSSTPKMDAIAENTSTAGVTIDGCLIKDGTVVPALASDPVSLTDGQWWYNTTSHVFKGRVNGATVTYAPIPSMSGNSGKALGNNGTTASWQTLQTLLPTVVVEDQKSSTTNGGTFTSGAWRTRDLNTEAVDTASIASVDSNQVTLPAGTYFCQFRAPANRTADHQAILYNVTTGATHILGSSGHANTSTQLNDFSVGTGVFTLAGSNVLEIRHRCVTTRATDGFGYPISFNTNVYTSVTFIKVA